MRHRAPGSAYGSSETGSQDHDFRFRYSYAFTLVELLVVIGIIGLVIAILVPTLSRARSASREVACASNMRQLTTALISYAGDFNSRFPPNSGELGQFWYLEPLIGGYTDAPDQVGRAGEVPPGAGNEVGLAGGIFVCPDDLEDSARSYSMNIFASGAVSSSVQSNLDSENPLGSLFGLNVTNGSSMILFAESWPELPVEGADPPVHVAQAILGLMGRPGERFGGNGGIIWTDPPDATPGRFEVRASQIAFYRHRTNEGGPIVAPRGRVNFAFADGHVQMVRQDELIASDGIRSSYRALWSPIDREVEDRAFGDGGD